MIDMDRSVEFHEILASTRAEGGEDVVPSSSSRKAPSIFLLKANEVVSMFCYQLIGIRIR